MGLSGPMEANNKQIMSRNITWLKIPADRADQLFIYKRGRGVDLRTTENNTS